LLFQAIVFIVFLQKNASSVNCLIVFASSLLGYFSICRLAVLKVSAALILGFAPDRIKSFTNSRF